MHRKNWNIAQRTHEIYDTDSFQHPLWREKQMCNVIYEARIMLSSLKQGSDRLTQVRKPGPHVDYGWKKI